MSAFASVFESTCAPTKYNILIKQRLHIGKHRFSSKPAVQIQAPVNQLLHPKQR